MRLDALSAWQTWGKEDPLSGSQEQLQGAGLGSALKCGSGRGAAQAEGTACLEGNWKYLSMLERGDHFRDPGVGGWGGCGFEDPWLYQEGGFNPFRV